MTTIWRYRGAALCVCVLGTGALACYINSHGRADHDSALHATDDNAPSSWTTPKMRGIEAEWHVIVDTAQKHPEQIPGAGAKSKSWQLHLVCERLLRKRLSNQDVRDLAASCGGLPTRIAEYSFTEDVLMFLVKALAVDGDREHLVRLLAMRCPTWVDHPRTIEYYLAVQGNHLSSALEILADAYLKCNVTETRMILALALRRAFDGFGIGGRTDDEFVKNAMRWYQEKMPNLELNEAYGRNAISPLKAPLFVNKPNTAKLPGPNDHYWLLANAYDPFPKEYPTKGAVAKLEGTWQVTNATPGGSARPARRLVGEHLVFHNGVLEWFDWDGIKKDQFVVDVDIESRTIPCAIDLREMPHSAQKRMNDTWVTEDLKPQQTTAAIYDLDDETLRVCLPSRGSRQRPTSFVPQEGSHESVLTLKRVKVEAALEPVW